MLWLHLVFVLGLMGAVAIVMRRRHAKPGAYADVDVGTVSENWLAEQRASEE
jgi:hypothetical protein